MARVIVFDVNETLLDLAALDALFEAAFGRAGMRQRWSERLIASALVSTVIGTYHDFGALGRVALETLAVQEGVDLPDARRDTILGTVRRLPPHAEVPGALERLSGTGLRLAALTNSTGEVARAQLEHAGLARVFERILSADTVRRLKPAPEPYEMAARELGVPIDQVRLVAAHGWDVAGALAAGAAAAFVARPGRALEGLAPRPDIVGADLAEVTERILAVEQPA